MAPEFSGTMKPRAGSYENTIDEPFRTVITDRSAVIRGKMNCGKLRKQMTAHFAVPRGRENVRYTNMDLVRRGRWRTIRAVI